MLRIYSLLRLNAFNLIEVVKNGLVECQHPHVVETGLTLLSQAHMPSSYWVAVFNTALYLINHLPSRLLGFKSPFEILFLQSPKYEFFSCVWLYRFPCLRPYNKKKWNFVQNLVSLMGSLLIIMVINV